MFKTASRKFNQLFVNHNLQARHFSSKGVVHKPDVLIVGGGPAGAALGATLSHSSFFEPSDSGEKKIMIVDPSRLPSLDTYKQKDRVPEPRVVTLSAASLRMLRSCGALQLCNQEYVTPFKSMQVYEQAGSAYMHFDPTAKDRSLLVQMQEQLVDRFAGEGRRDQKEEMRTHLGASIENSHLQAALLERVNQSGKVDIVAQKVASIVPAKSQNERPSVTLDDGTEIQPLLLVGSDGEKSLTRTEYNIGTWGQSYHQNGLVCTVKTIKPNEIAFQRFMKTGPIALLPLWENYSSIVWSLPTHLCKELQNIPEDQFIDQLNRVFYETSDASSIGRCADYALPRQIKSRNFVHPPLIEGLGTKRFAFPLILSHADSLAGHRLALIGDAGHRVHPLAGQGLNLGFTDVAYLANVILKAQRQGQDIGDLNQVLKEYENWSKANSYAMIAAIEFVKSSYGPKVMGSEGMGHVLAAARNIAIDMIEFNDLAKHNFMQFASGTAQHPSDYEWTQ